MITEELLNKSADLYINEKLSMENIAKLLNIKYNDLRKILPSKVKIRKNGETKRVTSKEIDDLIVSEYKDGFSLRELSKKYNVERSVINRVLLENGIEIRSIKESNIKKILDEPSIVKLYQSGSSISSIAGQLRCSTATIWKRLKKNNVKIRRARRNKTSKIRPCKFDKQTELEIIEKYVKNNYSCGKLSREYKTSHCVISGLLKRSNICIIPGRLKSQIYNIDESSLEFPNTPEFNLVMGLMFTDGNIIIKRGKYRFGIELQNQDKPALEFIKKYFSSSHPIYFSKGKNTNIFAVSNKKIALDFAKFGCVPNKTNILEYPSWIKDDLFKYFLLGCIIGDGWIYKSDKNPYFQVGFCGTKSMVSGIKNKVKELFNINGTIGKYSNSENLYRVSFNYFQAIRLCTHIFSVPVFLLERKYRPFVDFCKYWVNHMNLIRYSDSKEIVKEAIKVIEANEKLGFF